MKRRRHPFLRIQYKNPKNIQKYMPNTSMKILELSQPNMISLNDLVPPVPFCYEFDLDNESNMTD